MIESSATHFNGVDVGADLSLQSQDLITQSGVDVGNLAGTRYIIVGDDTRIRVVNVLANRPESVLLLRASSDPTAALADPLIDERGPVALNNGEVMNNSFNDTFTVEGVTRDLRWRNVAATATLGVIPTTFRDLEVSFPNASIDLGNRVITLSGNIGLYAGVDVANPAQNAAADFVVPTAANADISDTGAQVNAAGNGDIRAARHITLADVLGEQFQIDQHANFYSSAGNMLVGTDGVSTDGSVAYGIANFGSLQFNTTGNVTIQEDSSTDLQGVSVVGSQAQSTRLLRLTSAGSITDTVNATHPNASVTVFGDATLIANDLITLNDAANESLTVRTGDLGGDVGHASFTSKNNGDITVGSLGTTNFQSLQFNTTGNVTVQEDSDMDLQGVSVVGSQVRARSRTR